MLKKIIGSTLLLGLIGILVFGAINRTTDKTAQAQGNGSGQGRSEQEGERGGQGNGAGERGGEKGNGAGERQYPNYETQPETWETHTGVVTQVPADGDELFIETSAGELQIGTGPLDWAAEGFTLQLGESLQVSGYWEDNEFKAAQLTRLSDGKTVNLRDEYGRPAWAGNGRNSQQAENAAGQAVVNEWLQIQGVAASVDGDALVVQSAAGEQVELEGRPWTFAQEQGFAAQAGDQLALTGFYEGDEFEVGRIENLSSGQVVLLRDESGRPMWAGGGQRGS
jgi:hypothetical protein